MNHSNLELMVRVLATLDPALHYEPLPQSDVSGNKPLLPAHSLEELQHCCYRASFTTLFALTDKGKAAGCSVDMNGRMMFNKCHSIEALLHFLEIDFNTARLLECGDLIHKGTTIFSDFYNKPYADVTLTDTISRLQNLIHKTQE